MSAMITKAAILGRRDEITRLAERGLALADRLGWDRFVLGGHSWGGSIRMNLLGFVILRLDYAKPLDRPRKGSYWTVSLGPTF